MNPVEFAGMQESAGEFFASRPASSPDPVLRTSFPSQSALIQRSPQMNGAFAGSRSATNFAPSVAAHSRPGAEPALNVNQLANQVYEMLVKRLASERQRRGA